MKILITGGTGLLGRSLIATAGEQHRLAVLHLREYALSDGIEQFVLDVRERNRLDHLFDAHHFDLVIHAAGIANVDYVENHAEEGWQSNVVGTQNIVDLVRKHHSRLVYVSTNAVFDGKHAPYRESDIAVPVNKYGQIKLECENIIRRLCPDAAIVRPIRMSVSRGTLINRSVRPR